MKLVTRIAVLTLTVLAAAGCRSSAGVFCDKMEECHILPGVSVEQCERNLDDWLDGKSDARRDRCTDEMDDCAAIDNCQVFIACQQPSC